MTEQDLQLALARERYARRLQSSGLAHDAATQLARDADISVDNEGGAVIRHAGRHARLDDPAALAPLIAAHLTSRVAADAINRGNAQQAYDPVVHGKELAARQSQANTLNSAAFR